jgi:hypothetical protein
LARVYGMRETGRRPVTTLGSGLLALRVWKAVS